MLAQLTFAKTPHDVTHLLVLIPKGGVLPKDFPSSALLAADIKQCTLSFMLK